MSEFDRLGDALRAEMHAVVKDVTPSADLIAQIDGIRPARRGALRSLPMYLRGRPIALALPFPIAALVAALLLVGGATVAPSSAGAILVLPDGEVRVTISQIVHVAGANAELRARSIHNIVVRPMSASCSAHPSMSYDGLAKVPPPRITLTPRTVAHGWRIVIAAEQIGPNKIEMAIGRFAGRLPECVSSRGSGPGLGTGSRRGQTGPTTEKRCGNSDANGREPLSEPAPRRSAGLRARAGRRRSLWPGRAR